MLGSCEKPVSEPSRYAAPRRVRVWCGMGAIAVGAVSARASGQEASRSPLLDSLLDAHSLTLELRDGALSGPGADFILSTAGNAQFVALGEDHNNMEIPELTAALFRVLQTRFGYHYFIEEQDPATMQRISRPPLRGHLDSLVALARRYSHAFTFVSDQELRMLADIGATSSAKTDPIWGCDQAFGVSIALEDLMALPLTNTARSYVKALRDSANAKERIRDLDGNHYIATDSTAAASLADLNRLVDPTTGSPADLLVHNLVVSNRIYRNWLEGRRYQANYEREEYMKGCFLEHYRQAESAGHEPPRVLMKFGHNHLVRGFGYTNLQSLGDFVSQFAVAEGAHSFHVAVFPNNASGYGDLASWQDSTPRLLASRTRPTEWTVIDLRALRPVYDRLVPSSLSAAQRENLHRWVFGFDAALFVGGAHPASYALDPGVKY
jgi:hypothetical protein